MYLADLNLAEIERTVFADNAIALKTEGRGRTVTIKDSAFVGSRTGHVDHLTSEELSARGNWWVTAEPRRIARSIQDGRDLPGRGQVDARDFLTAKPDNVGASLQP